MHVLQRLLVLAVLRLHRELGDCERGDLSLSQSSVVSQHQKNESRDVIEVVSGPGIMPLWQTPQRKQSRSEDGTRKRTYSADTAQSYNRACLHCVENVCPAVNCTWRSEARSGIQILRRDCHCLGIVSPALGVGSCVRCAGGMSCDVCIWVSSL